MNELERQTTFIFTLDEEEDYMILNLYNNQKMYSSFYEVNKYFQRIEYISLSLEWYFVYF